MIKIAICDDENFIVNQIENLLIKVSKYEAIQIDIDVFYCGNLLEKEIASRTRYDLIYLDIQMERGDGIIAAKNIRKIDENVLIIFVSGHEKYLMELFRLDVFAFIKKPIISDIFIKSFLDATRKIRNRNYYYTYRYKSQEYKIPCNEILFFESIGRQININLRSGETCCFNGKLNDVEIHLMDGKIPFLRIHQSYLVNYHLIKCRSRSTVTLTNNMKLPISEEKQKKFSYDYNGLLRGEFDV